MIREILRENFCHGCVDGEAFDLNGIRIINRTEIDTQTAAVATETAEVEAGIAVEEGIGITVEGESAFSAARLVGLLRKECIAGGLYLGNRSRTRAADSA